MAGEDGIEIPGGYGEVEILPLVGYSTFFCITIFIYHVPLLLFGSSFTFCLWPCLIFLCSQTGDVEGVGSGRK